MTPDRLFTRQGCVTIDEASDKGAWVDALAWAALFNRSERPLGSLAGSGPTSPPPIVSSLLHSSGIADV